MPDLGKYAFEVLSAYAVSLLLLGGLIWISLRQASRMRRRLEEQERRMNRNG